MDQFMSTKIQYLTKLEQLKRLNAQERADLAEVTDKFAFRGNDYYLSLIDWDDPDDPIRRIIIPDIQELDEWGSLDPSDEKAFTVMPGLEHKYNSTALLLVSDVCDGICRYCFRKRVFMDSRDDCIQNLPAALKYIDEHDEITNVLLTGGDSLSLPTPELENIVCGLREIDHVKIIRIGTKMPAFNPYRIIDDPGLLEMVAKYSDGWKTIYVMTHFVHPRELTDPAIKALGLLRKAGAVIANQAPLIRGVNDSPEVLAELLEKLSYIGVAPYYIFQCRPALNNSTYTVPIEEGYEIFEQAMSKVSGLAKRTRFVMSHSSGKMEILGMTEEAVFFRYHRAACDEDSGRLMVFRRNPDACWFDDYDEAVQACSADMPYGLCEPE
jgi:lysine 2,3-aminomutase